MNETDKQRRRFATKSLATCCRRLKQVAPHVACRSWYTHLNDWMSYGNFGMKLVSRTCDILNKFQWDFDKVLLHFNKMKFLWSFNIIFSVEFPTQHETNFTTSPNTNTAYAQSLTVLVRIIFSLDIYASMLYAWLFWRRFLMWERKARKFVELRRPWILRASTPFANINFIDLLEKNLLFRSYDFRGISWNFSSIFPSLLRNREKLNYAMQLMKNKGRRR